MYLDDEEVDQICDGYVQNAAKIRFLLGLGLVVVRKPNGRPLVLRNQFIEMARYANQAPAAQQPMWSVN